MPNIKSAIKRVDITKKRTLRNNIIKSKIKTAIRNFETAVENGASDEAKTKLVNALSTIDKATSKGVLHKNTAARKKSRLERLFKKAQNS